MVRGAGGRLSGSVLALMLATSSCCAQPDGDGAAPGRHAVVDGAGTGRAQNVILLVGDGMGMAHRDLIRLATVGRDGELAMNQLRHQGWSRTDPADPTEVVTDSAAAATALATGVRTTNGAVSVDPEGQPVTTLLERAAESGRATGLVTTSQVTDATPAAFAAHVGSRDEHSEIARQYLEQTRVDVMLGGGEDWWYPEGTEGRRPDGPSSDPTEGSRGSAGNLVERAQELGYEYVADADGLAEADGELLLGLFANQEMFEHGQDAPERGYEPAVPLPQMTAKALEILSRDEDGFFLVVEEEGIDGMAHRNDAGLMVEAGRALDEAVALAREFATERGSTLVVVTGDHETGGLTIESVDDDEDEDEDERRGDLDGPIPLAGADLELTVRWATTSHSGVAVPVSAEGPGAERMVRVRSHTDVHDFVLAAMRLDEP